MSWQPQQEGLEEVLSMLRSSSSGESEVQKAVAKVCLVPLCWPGIIARSHALLAGHGHRDLLDQQLNVPV